MPTLFFGQETNEADSKADDKKNWPNNGASTLPAPGNGNTKAPTTPPISNGSESPRSGRSKRFQSLTGQETISLTQATNGPAAAAASPSDMETLKHEILAEVRKEIQKAKSEIIDAIRAEMNRR